MRIGDRHIDEEFPPYVIAEIGVNHDGSVERALELTDAAAGAGADAVKLQLFRTDLLMSRAAKLAAYQAAAGETDPVGMLRRLELSADEMARVVERAHARGIHAIVTVFSVGLVAEAERLPWDAYKSASPDIINRPLLEAMAATGKPLIVSTGASTMEEVERAVGWLAGAKERLALLQCVSSYPTAPEDAAVGAMADFRRWFQGPVGYSDHTPDLDTGQLAAAMGADLLEKHLTYDRTAPGPDHAASCDAAGLARYAQLARGVRDYVMVHGGGRPLPRAVNPDDPRIGGRHKRVQRCEFDVREVSRQSLTTRCALNSGHVLALRDLTIKRPGSGIEPWRVEEIVGRRLARDVAADMPLTDEDLS
ncbi:MAG TPA: N-acetylneuraminate synthase family protein [Phycisphaerales bacterium]|nr:N-acetylneuraminate synthase family protein [Phycisphaerales bacterium]